MPASSRDAARPTPYGSAAEHYWDRGWRGVLPLPLGTKKITIIGWTGWLGITPSWPDIQAWIDDSPGSNIALRLPPDILGLDIDAYSGKAGRETLAWCEAQWGVLPPTWRTTSRDDGISGIRLFRVPEGLNWPGQLPGGGAETVHVGHRYAVVSPSIHPEGRRYRWIGPDGVDTIGIPAPADLPMLPTAWVIGLARGRHVDEPSADMARSEISDWLAHTPGYTEPPCERMTALLRKTMAVLMGDGTSRHEGLLPALLTMVRFADDGHHGLHQALNKIRTEFLVATAADKSRSENEALGELQRALAGAVAKVSASPGLAAGTAGDPCHPNASALATPPRVSSPPAAPVVAAEPAPPPAVPPTENLPPDPFALDPADQTVETAAPVVSAAVVSSWVHLSIELALQGLHIEAPPTILARTDGVHLLYAGRINGIIGPSESGKSWLALEAVRQVLAAGHKVIYIDFEDTVPGVIGRLLSLQTEPDTLRAQFTYIGPSEPLTPSTRADLAAEIIDMGSEDLIVLDGFNAAMTLQGLDLMSNKDVTVFYQLLLALLINSNSCIAYVDHTPKNDGEGESRGGIGAQAKRAMTTGTILRCDIKTPFGRDQVGYITILVDKDRSGYIRGISPNRKAGSAKIDSTTIDGVNRVAITIEPPDSTPTGTTESGADYVRPTFLMRRVSDYLATHPGSSGRNVRDDVQGKVTYVLKALDALVLEGYVSTAPGIRGAVLHTLDRPYIEELDPLVPPVPSGARAGTGTGQESGFSGSPNPQTTSGGTGNHSTVFREQEKAVTGSSDEGLFDTGDDE